MYWQNAQLIRTLREKSGPVAALAFSPDSLVLAIGSCDSAVKLFQVATGDRERTLFGYPLGVNCLSVSPNGKAIAIGAPDGTIDLWQLGDGKLLGKITLDGRVTSVAFSPDGQILASASDRSLVDTVFAASPTQTGGEKTDGGAIELWDANTGHLKQTLCESETPVNTLAISPDGTMLASGHRDGTIKLWQLGGRLKNGRLLHTLRGHRDAVYAIAIAKVGPPLTPTRAAANSPIKDSREDEDIRPRDGARESEPEQNLGSNLKSDLKAQLIVSGSGDGTLRLWDLETGTSTKTLADHTDVVYSLSISPNGQILASGSGDGTIKLWQLDGTLLQTIPHSLEPLRAVMSVAFSPNSSLLASGSGDGRIHIWQGMGNGEWGIGNWAWGIG